MKAAFGLSGWHLVPGCLVLLGVPLFPAAVAQDLDSGARWQSRATAIGLEPRHIHTAIWTGHEMIVWGGEGLQRTFKSGARYNPSTDSWTYTSTSGAPARRTEHRAVWTGQEMIVWGGFGEDNTANIASGYAYGDGARYNPVSDSWMPVSTSGAPNFRMGHTAIWTGDAMLVWGGYHGTNWYKGLVDDAFYGDGARYDPATDTWTPISSQNAPSQRALHVAVWTGTEMLVWGGSYRGRILGDGARYNPATDTWTPMSSTNAPARSSDYAAWTGTEMLIWGGSDGTTGGATGGGRYDPATDGWKPLNKATEPSPRYSVAQTDTVSVWTGYEMMVWGQFGLPSGFPQTGGRYNPATDSWFPTTLTNAPTGRSASLLWTGKEVLLFGGWRGSYFNTTYAYTPPGPVITRQPRSLDVPRNRAATFAVSVQSSLPLSFQWFKNGLEIGGATNASFTIAQVQLTDEGSYTVTVRSFYGTVSSAPAGLTVADIDSAELEIHFYAGLTITGTVGKSYRIEYADGSQPGVWTPITTITLPTNPFLWFDPDSASQAKRFYRAVLVP